MPPKKVIKPIESNIEPPLVPVYNPNETDIVARVFIEEKCVAAYKMPLVEKPPARYADIKTYNKENWPAQAKSALPDVFPELPDKTRAYLKLAPYGNNVIINKKQITKLLNFFFEIKDLPLPDVLNVKLKEQLNYVRSLVGLIGIDESEANSNWKKIYGDEFIPMYPYYRCTCASKKRNPKKSPGAKALKSKQEDDNDE